MPDLHAPTVGSGPTSQPTAGAREQLTLPQLIAKKENLEAELHALGSVLDSHKVNMSTPLLTPDGFPRADLDVAQIRTTRARIIRLKNDYKDIMSKLEVAVQAQFAAGKGIEGMAPASARTGATNGAAASAGAASAGAAQSSAIEPPFAKVNTVVPNSPADQAGMLAGDKIMRFGSVNWMNHERLSKVAQVVQQSENVCAAWTCRWRDADEAIQQSILIKVLRDTGDDSGSATLDLRLTPRRDWGGRGLLGCHLLPL
ncbi:putative 26S proteasome regulatory subunit [Teratosphaeriaceae sp. CCFEE 6253]|nr:putative 26S proteasome regulatory subunit [Teratosphaeriaceae sp. CCFEE 6253]